jgi:Fungalysin metallopeptidase (M36)
VGEGWGDFFATILRTTANNTRDDDFGMGEYSAGNGIRVSNHKVLESSSTPLRWKLTLLPMATSESQLTGAFMPREKFGQ